MVPVLVNHSASEEDKTSVYISIGYNSDEIMQLQEKKYIYE